MHEQASVSFENPAPASPDAWKQRFREKKKTPRRLNHVLRFPFSIIVPAVAARPGEKEVEFVVERDARQPGRPLQRAGRPDGGRGRSKNDRRVFAYLGISTVG